MKRFRTYAFRSPMTLPEIRARLDEVGSWRWLERESDHRGDYISARVVSEPGHGMAKIFIEADRYALDLELDADQAELGVVHETLFVRLLPAIAAAEIVQTDPPPGGDPHSAGATNKLGELFAAHLRAPSRDADELVAALQRAGLDNESSAFDAWRAGKREIAARDVWLGKRVAVSAAPPATPAAGDLWFDICELALMVCTGRTWLATRPIARWQMRGFLEVAVTEPREVQVKPPYRALDPARLLEGDELESCTMLTAGEASLYAWWFGKGQPHLFDWQAAQEALPPAAMRALWQTSSKEWTTTKLNCDEGARIFVTPSTIDWDPDDDDVLAAEGARSEADRRMIRGEFTRERDIGARTSVHLQSGLYAKVTAWWLIPEDVRLAALLDRSRFQ